MANKTKVDFFNEILAVPAVAENEEYVAFLNKEIDLLKNKSSKANAKKAKETEERVNALFDELVRLGKPITVKDFIAETGLDTTEFTKERVTALLRKLTQAGKVTTEKKGKITTYTVVTVA